MKRTGQMLLWLLIVSACVTAAVPNKELMTMYQDALYQEQTAGDLDKAIEIYQKVVADSGEIEKLAAKATFQLGMCYLKKDDKTKAAEYFKKIVEQYPGQKEVAGSAKEQLDKIVPPSINPGLPAEVLGYLYEKHSEAGKKAGQLGISFNTHVYGVDGFRKFSGGLLNVYNAGTEAWTEKRDIGTFTPNNKDLKLVNEQFQEQVFEWGDVGFAQNRRSHLLWTPDRPVQPGETRVLGYVYNANPELPSTPDGYELVMTNHYGSEVLENFFLVLPSTIKIVKTSHDITSQKQLGQIEVFQFERHIKDEKNVVTVILEFVDLTTADSPIVVKTSPVNFANNVSPETSEITVTFNQEMSTSGYAWCRNQHPFPNGSGTPQFSNGNYSCSKPVKLKPGQYYRVAINTPPYQSFRNVKGDPARHYVLVFATADEKGQPTKIPSSVIEEANKINFKTLSPEELADIVEEAVATISTCAETDPRIKDAFDSLAGLDSNLVATEVCKHLDSATDNVRRAAIYTLWKGGLSDITAAQVKLIELCSHTENTTRGMAALTLSSIKTQASLDAIIKMAEDTDVYARRCAVYALGLSGDTKAIAVVEKALQDQDPSVKSNAQAAMTMLTKQAGDENLSADSGSTSIQKIIKPNLTQEMFNDIQPDGTIKFRNPQQIVNTGTEPITEQRFINSDFVQLTAMTDQQGRPIPFTATHDSDIYRYHVTLDKPVLPGQTMTYYAEGTISGLIKPVAGTQDTYRYSMTHSPATGQPTLRIEQYLLPVGARVISTTPKDMQQSEKDGRIELKVEKVIPANGSLTTSFKYKLAQ